ncbi:uncharacterized protein [Equus przewalskii]|uniref:Uncharacterized protein n=1 Tax=Equus przewalskii TaxID=9798 RepID=A0ABM4KA03_EQUPR
MRAEDSQWFREAGGLGWAGRSRGPGFCRVDQGVPVLALPSSARSSSEFQLRLSSAGAQRTFPEHLPGSLAHRPRIISGGPYGELASSACEFKFWGHSLSRAHKEHPGCRCGLLSCLRCLWTFVERDTKRSTLGDTESISPREEKLCRKNGAAGVGKRPASSVTLVQSSETAQDPAHVQGEQSFSAAPAEEQETSGPHDGSRESQALLKLVQEPCSRLSSNQLSRESHPLILLLPWLWSWMKMRRSGTRESHPLL